MIFQTKRALITPKARQVRARRTTGSVPATRLWLFDLDNTLHDASHAIFPEINRCMTQAVRDTLGVDEDEAHRLRKLYWQRYGATVIGMVRHHGVNAATFLASCHNFHAANLIHAEKGLAQKLRRLPGRKVLLTNAPLNYAREVLACLGILRQFKSVWSIEHMQWHSQYRPKPSAALLRYVLARESVAAHQATLVEDTLVNLRSARQVGLRTVYVYHPGTPFLSARHARPAYVDLRVNSVSDLLLSRRPLRA